ncbi:hypothetical protein C4K30_2641 [Pseudomonas chlororaphis subsp. piscium]|nr:hypothetical protein C4K30_2641 [Pseudomonas chlororaphis subsp. piscium]
MWKDSKPSVLTIRKLQNAEGINKRRMLALTTSLPV